MGNKSSKAGKALVVAAQNKNENEALYWKQQTVYWKQQTERQTLETAFKSAERKMNIKGSQLKSLEKEFNEIKDEGKKLEREANEAVTTYENNVQSIMLYHGIASIFLQLAFPYAGSLITILLVISFFSTFLVASISTYEKFDKTSRLDKDLQRRLRDLENEVTRFEANIKMIHLDNDMKVLGENGYREEVIENVNLLNRNVAALNKDISGIQELSQSESNRMKPFLQVAVGAVMFGLCFPLVSYGLLSLIGGFRSTGLINRI